MYLFALHVPEEDVCPDRLGHEVGAAQQLLHGLGRIQPGVEQIVPGAEDADDVVGVLLIDREPGQTGGPDGLHDLLVGVAGPDHHHIGAVYHHVLGHGVVEVKDVFDHLFFVGLHGALFLADVHKSAKLLLRHRFPARVGPDAGDAEEGVADGLQPPPEGLDGGGEQGARQKQGRAAEYERPYRVRHGGFPLKNSHFSRNFFAKKLQYIYDTILWPEMQIFSRESSKAPFIMI